MIAKQNAHLLKDGVRALLDAPYFSKEVHDYVLCLHEAVEVVIGRWNDIPDQLRRKAIDDLWRTHKYIAGSTSNDIPFEIECCLKKALCQWIPSESYLITTALSQEPEFHFCPSNPWLLLHQIAPGLPVPKQQLVQISLPKLYKHSPLYCVPLFHELGHFIDTKYGITALSLTKNSACMTEASQFAQHFPGRVKEIEVSHRCEVFADLFAACYLGMSNVRFLVEFVGEHPANMSHPSSRRRKEIAWTMCGQKNDKIVDLINGCLVSRGLRKIEIQYENPPDAFDALRDCRPVAVKNDKQLFGLFRTSWIFLHSATKQGSSTWLGVPNEKKSQMANDLTEKAIRNYAIHERWLNAHSAKA